MHLITIHARVCERVNTGQTESTLFRSFARRNMAITEISVADSITRGYYYVVEWMCARARLYAFDAFVEIKGKSAMPIFRDASNGRSAGILWCRLVEKNTHYANARVIALSDFSQK